MGLLDRMLGSPQVAFSQPRPVPAAVLRVAGRRLIPGSRMIAASLIPPFKVARDSHPLRSLVHRVSPLWGAAPRTGSGSPISPSHPRGQSSPPPPSPRPVARRSVGTCWPPARRIRLMRTVFLVLAILATLGIAVVSGSGVAPASEGAPLRPANSYLSPGDRANPGVCTDTNVMSSVELDSGSPISPASLVLTTAGDYCESHDDCASGQECDFDLGECVEASCDQVCGWVRHCSSYCDDPCTERKWRCWYEWECWIECDD